MGTVHDLDIVRADGSNAKDQEMLDYFLSQPPTITKEQCAQARAALSWSIEALAFRSGASVKAITQYEAGERELRDVTRQALTFAFEVEGLLLITDQKPLMGMNCRGMMVDPRQRPNYHLME